MSVPQPPPQWLYVVQAPCWRCARPAALAMVGSPCGTPQYFYGPENFTEPERARAQTRQAVLRLHHSKSQPTPRWGNTCGHCNAHLGEHYLYREYFLKALEGVYTYQTLNIETTTNHEKLRRQALGLMRENW